MTITEVIFELTCIQKYNPDAEVLMEYDCGETLPIRTMSILNENGVYGPVKIITSKGKVND